MQVDVVRPFCLELLNRYSVSPDDATLLVDSLIAADLKGVSSHGLNMLQLYVKRLKANLLESKSEFVVERDMGAIAVVNGKNSISQLIGHRAMELAIDKAAQYGIGAVVATNSGHFGMASAYGLQAAKRNMIGIVMSNVAPLMPAPGGAARIIGNNPLAVVAPTRSDPIVSDLGLSKVVVGKLLVAKAKGEKIPADCVLDKEGNPTEDAQKALEGLLLPIAGPKGYALAVAIEILTGVLGGLFSSDLSSLGDMSQRQHISHLMLALNIEAFLPLEEYFDRIEKLKSGIKNSKKAPGVSEVYLPGEISLTKQKRAGTNPSIVLQDSAIQELNKLAIEVGMTPLATGTVA